MASFIKVSDQLIKPICSNTFDQAFNIDRARNSADWNLQPVFILPWDADRSEAFRGKKMTGFLRCQRAATAVEFAMLLPLFLAFIFGIVIFGSYLTMVHGVQQLAAEAARSSVAGLTDSERNSLATSYVSANAATYPLLIAAKLSVNAAPSGANVYVVTVNYDASTSFIYTLPFVPAPSSTIVRSAAVPYGGF
jgi:Flp pilus assembly protein TadG